MPCPVDIVAAMLLHVVLLHKAKSYTQATHSSIRLQLVAVRTTVSSHTLLGGYHKTLHAPLSWYVAFLLHKHDTYTAGGCSVTTRNVRTSHTQVEYIV